METASDLGVFDKSGIRFLHPSNWKIVDEDFESLPQSVTVQSPGSAFWSLHVYPVDVDVTQLFDECLTGMREEYEDLESQTVQDEVAGYSTEGLDINLYCLDLLVQVQVRAIELEGALFLTIAQGESREFEENHLIWRAMTMSLLEK